MLLRAQRKRIHVNTLIRASSVRLEGLHQAEVSSFTLRESILAIELQLGSDYGIWPQQCKSKEVSVITKVPASDTPEFSM